MIFSLQQNSTLSSEVCVSFTSLSLTFTSWLTKSVRQTKRPRPLLPCSCLLTIYKLPRLNSDGFGKGAFWSLSIRRNDGYKEKRCRDYRVQVCITKAQGASCKLESRRCWIERKCLGMTTDQFWYCCPSWPLLIMSLWYTSFNVMFFMELTFITDGLLVECSRREPGWVHFVSPSALYLIRFDSHW